MCLTGHLCYSGADAKSKDMKTTQQEEVEWMEYNKSFREIANESGIPLQNFFDLRGNHDKYGVPLQSPLDYYSKYSITAAMNRSGSLVQSVTIQVWILQQRWQSC